MIQHRERWYSHEEAAGVLCRRVLGALSVLLALPTREARRRWYSRPPGSDGRPGGRGRVEPSWGAQRWPARDQLGVGGGWNDTTPPANPFDVFLNVRGARLPRRAVVWRGACSGAPGASSTIPPMGRTSPCLSPRLFTRWAATSPRRCSSPPAQRKVPGSGPWLRRGLHGRGPAGRERTRQEEETQASTRIEYYGVDGDLIFTSFVPAAPGNAGLSFFGVVFADPASPGSGSRGNVAPGPDDRGSTSRHDGRLHLR